MNPANPVALALIAAALALHSVAYSQHSHSHAHKPLHGGVVVEASDVDFELVAKADVVTLYVRDHGKPIDLKGASGKIVLLSGTDKVEAALAPVEGNALQAKGAFKVTPGTKAVSTVTLPGKKPITARFVIK
jgi:predicted nuclease with RNAse H fold